jgi:hypothetical protein
MSWVIVINSSFDAPETYYAKKVVHVQLMLVSFCVLSGALLYCRYSQIVPPPPGDGQTTDRGPSTARWEAQCGPRKVSKMLKKRGFEKYFCEHNKTFKNEGGIMERERRDKNHVKARLSHSASQHLLPDLHFCHCLLFRNLSSMCLRLWFIIIY